MSANQLGQETSPYLLQHKDNPVHWQAWGPEALAKAQATGKPILLSVGYAACHWCHVMAHESFEHHDTAKVMNELFINIKVDREERPDIDGIYMSALHKLGEQGGWPLTMFLTSDARPFWGGTYFPREDRFGRPAFVRVLQEVARIFSDDPEKVEHDASALTTALRARETTDQTIDLSEAVLADTCTRFVTAMDPVNGGLKGAPKFPQWTFLWLLWRGGIRYDLAPCRDAVENTLTHICQGGIYDHLGGGFSRYSVDERWLAPHFEKMLYDNALLVDLLSEVWRETKSDLYRIRVEETVTWLLREMIADGGGFAASLDADSEGEEGKFYVWTLAEIRQVLGDDDAETFAQVYDAKAEGNWEGKVILNRLANLDLREPHDETKLAVLRKKLFDARAPRVRPGWDDKVLADWNGMMIAALTHAGAIFDKPDWLAAAQKAYAFVKEQMMHEGRLRHAFRSGQAKAPATSADYANMIWAALRLYQVHGTARYLADVERMAETLDRHYWLSDDGGYAVSADDTPDVIVRMRSAHDDAVPNANATMISNLMALFLLTGNTAYSDRAHGIVHAFGAEIGRNQAGHSGLLACAFDLVAPQHIVIAGAETEGTVAGLRAQLRRLSMPGAVEQFISDAAIIPASSPIAGKGKINGDPAGYVCVGPQCSAPATTPDAFFASLHAARKVEISSV
jgi:uncharacterized protein YyaL (SSP411 family)